MTEELVCPGCQESLDTIAANGRPDDLYLCSSCYHSWFRFELGEDNLTHLAPSDFGDDLYN